MIGLRNEEGRGHCPSLFCARNIGNLGQRSDICGQGATLTATANISRRLHPWPVPAPFRTVITTAASLKSNGCASVAAARSDCWSRRAARRWSTAATAAKAARRRRSRSPRHPSAPHRPPGPLAARSSLFQVEWAFYFGSRSPVSISQPCNAPPLPRSVMYRIVISSS